MKFDALRALSVPVLGALASFWSSSPAVAQEPLRLAYVVTNQQYPTSNSKGHGSLLYPDSDGLIVSAALEKVGFNVRWLRDGSKAAFKSELDGFIGDLRRAGPHAIAFFYFSGHTAPDRAAGVNYLILNERVPSRPAEGGSENIDHDLPMIGIPLRTITSAIAVVNAEATFVVVDSHLDVAEPALINDAVRMQGSEKRHNGMMLVAQGRPGMQAADSNDFSRALAGAVQTVGLDAFGVFKQVQVRVAETTKGRQVPWIEDRLLKPFRFVEETQVPPSTQKDPKGADASREISDRLDLALWDAVKDSSDPRLLRAYLTRYPQGNFAPVAKIKLDVAPQGATQFAPRAAGPKTERRIALVIGNSDYAHARLLYNPKHDAKAVGAILKEKLRFNEVQVEYDLGKQALLKALRTFGERAATADWALIYYAGHGIESQGTNYLIPTDATLEREDDVDDETVPVSRLLDRVSGAKVVKIVILDACRDNPFLGRMRQRGRTRGGASGGLGPMRADSGTLIAYAAAPGEQALDGTGNNSPYALALLQHMGEPGLDIRLMFGKVLDSVLEQSNGTQQPWFSSALGGAQFQFNPN